mmetsp:Transcript_68392/g.152657  ORF Transcript_68392/g.152657 Transcript_68392/m.152657 type:complete len:295 (+) Transcript_68392:143-1027(+)
MRAWQVCLHPPRRLVWFRTAQKGALISCPNGPNGLTPTHPIPFCIQIPNPALPVAHCTLLHTRRLLSSLALGNLHVDCCRRLAINADVLIRKDVGEHLGQVNTQVFERLKAAQLLVILEYLRLDLRLGHLDHVPEMLLVLGILCLTLLFRLSVEKAHLMVDLPQAQLLFLVRPLLAAAELHGLLRLLHLGRVALKPQLGPLRDRVVVHRLKLLTSRVTTVDHLEQGESRLAHAILHGGEGADVPKARGALQQRLIRVLRAERHHVRRESIDKVANRVVTGVEHLFNVDQLVEHH